MTDKEIVKFGLRHADNPHTGGDYDRALAALDRMAASQSDIQMLLEQEVAGCADWLERKGYVEAGGRLRRDRPTLKSEAVKECLTTEPPVVETAGAATPAEGCCWICGSNAWLSDRSCAVCGGSVSSRESGTATLADSMEWSKKDEDQFIALAPATPASWGKLAESGEWPEYGDAQVGTNATERIAAALESIAGSIERIACIQEMKR